MGTNTGVVAFFAFFFLLLPFGMAIETNRDPLDITIPEGKSVTITLTFSSNGNDEGAIISEMLPEGWDLLSSTPAFIKNAENDYKWLFSEKDGLYDFSVTYTVLPSFSSVGTYSLKGSWKSISKEGTMQEGSSGESIIRIIKTQEAVEKVVDDEGGKKKTPPSSIIEDEQQPLCPLGKRTCEGNFVFLCTENGWKKEEECPFECTEGQCIYPLENEPVPETKGPELTGRFLEQSSLAAGIVAVAIIGLFFWRSRRKQSGFHYRFGKR